MKKNNKSTDLPKWIYFLFLFVTLFSIVAIIISLAALDVPMSQLGFSMDNAITIAGIIIGVSGVVATIYFVIMGLEIQGYKKEIDRYKRDMERISKEVYETTELFYTNADFILSSAESVADKNHKYIRLARGRLVCQSPFASEEDKENGIAMIQENSTDPRDVEILQKIVDGLESKDKLSSKEKHLKDVAEKAVTDMMATINSENTINQREKNGLVAKMKELFNMLFHGKLG